MDEARPVWVYKGTLKIVLDAVRWRVVVGLNGELVLTEQDRNRTVDTLVEHVLILKQLALRIHRHSRDVSKS